MIARVLRARLNRKCQTKILSFGFAPFMGTEPLKLNAVVAAWVQTSVADRASTSLEIAILANRFGFLGHAGSSLVALWGRGSDFRPTMEYKG